MERDFSGPNEDEDEDKFDQEIDDLELDEID